MRVDIKNKASSETELGVTVEFRGDHIYLRHGEDFHVTPESMDEFWKWLSEVCRRYDCSFVLAEGPPPHRDMGPVDAFDSGVKAAAAAEHMWLAICFHDYETDEVSELFKHTARNRGVHVKFFNDTEQGLKWLRAGQQAHKPLK